ncbi:hypothetical protein [Cohnella soli]|uniref:Endolytic transglycosylase MltG n=1 Tax=Cohnella soli TaxID=425005 RepID=A0ABW0HL76_9BACL
MRKHRNWLIGFGLGIMLGASMLQLINTAREQTEGVAMTRDQLDAQAKEQGLLLLTDKELQQRLDEAVSSSVPSKGKAGEESDQPPASPSSSKGVAPVTEPTEPSASVPTEPDAPVVSPSNDKVTLYIGAGMSLTEVAESLQKLGIVDDSKDFIEQARPIAKKMNVGNAIFTGKPTYEQIIAELVRKKR